MCRDGTDVWGPVMDTQRASTMHWEIRERRARFWAKNLFRIWVALLVVFVVVLAATLASPGELLHLGRRDLYVLAGAALLAELILTLPILVAAAVLDSRAKRILRASREERV